MRDHTSLRVWQCARKLVIDVHRMAGRIWHPSLAAILEQLRRSSLSVQLNIAEGQALGSGRQFARHLTIAYGSAIESVELIDLLRELAPDHEHELKSLADNARRNGSHVLALKRSIVRRLWFRAQDPADNGKVPRRGAETCGRRC